MLHHVLSFVYTCVKPCSHLCYIIFTPMLTPMLHHVHTYFTHILHHVHIYVTPCSHLCLHPIHTYLYHVHNYVYTYVTPCSQLCLHLCYTMFTPMFTHMLHNVHTYVYTYVTPCSHMFKPDNKGGGNPFSDLGPQRGPYFLVKLNCNKSSLPYVHTCL